MAESLVLELPRSVDQKCGDFIKDLAALIAEIAQSTHGQWEELCRAGMAGRAAEVHEKREEFLERLERRLDWIRHARQMVQMATQVANEDFSGDFDFDQVVADLEELKNRIFPRWQTQEDLEDMLVEMYPLSNKRLEEIRKALPFPQQWYDEDDKPF